MEFILKIFFVIIFISACKTTIDKKNIITIDKINVEEIKKFSYEGVNPVNVQQIGDTLIVNYYPQINILYFYSLSHNRLIDSLGFNDFYLNNFFFINKDSIYLFGDNEMNKEKGYIYVVDSKADIKKKIKLSTNYNYPSSCLFLLDENNLFSGKIVYTLQDYALCGLIGNKKQYSGKEIVAIVDVRNANIYLNEAIKYPYLNRKETFYPDGLYDYYHIEISQILKNKVIIGFRYTPMFYVWDVVNNSIETKKLKSEFIDTIIPCKSLCDNADLASYSNFYKLNDSIFIRLVQLKKEYAKTLLYLLFNKKFEYLGESVVSKKDPYIWFYNTLSNFNFTDDRNNTLKFIKANVELKYTTLVDIKNRLEIIKNNYIKNENEQCKLIGIDSSKQTTSEQILNYFKKVHQISENSFSVLVQNKNGCGSCNSYLDDFIKVNASVLFKIKTKPFYVLSVGSSENITELMTKYNISTTTNLKIDTTDLYSKIHPFSYYNPRLILVKNNKIISDTIYMPDKLEVLIDRLLNFYGFEAEK